VNYDNSLVVSITVTCNSWAPSSGDNLFTCGAIFWSPHWRPRLVTSPSQARSQRGIGGNCVNMAVVYIW